MKAWRLLMLPWMAWSRTARSVAAACFIAVIGGAVLVATFTYSPGPAWIDNVTHSVAVVNALLWACVMSQSLLLAREAWQLRLPALGRKVNASLALYAMLGIGLPSMLLTWLGGNGVAIATEIALGAGLGMAYATLPPLLGVFALWAPSLHDHLAHWLPMPTTSPTGFLLWAIPCTTALWLLIGWRWHHGVRHEHAMQGTHKPILLTIRSKMWYGRSGDANMEARLVGQRARWLQPAVDLRGCGPDHPLRSLRVALGGLSMPQMPTSRLRQLVVLPAAALLAFLLFGVPSSGSDRHADMLSLIGGTDMLLLYIGMIGPLLAIGHVQRLQRRWNRCNAELPLLALLPGLGDAAQTRRALLRASLLPMLGLQTALLLATITLAGYLHLDARGDALLLLGQLAGMGLLVAFSLAALGGVAIGHWWMTVSLIYGYLLINASSAVAPPMFGSHALAEGIGVMIGLALLWATFLTPLAMLGMRGWRGFRQRPHPFLPTT